MTVILDRVRAILADTAAWGDRAACIGKAPILEDPDLETEAKTLCLGDPSRGIPRCPVIDACNTWVLDLPARQDPGGIRAGLTEKERTSARSRRTMARARRPVAKVAPAPAARPKPAPRPVVTVAAPAVEPVPPGKKRCSKCKQVKNRAEFYIETRAKDGLASMCAACKRAVNADSKVKRRDAGKPAAEKRRRRADAAYATQTRTSRKKTAA